MSEKVGKSPINRKLLSVSNKKSVLFSNDEHRGVIRTFQRIVMMRTTEQKKRELKCCSCCHCAQLLHAILAQLHQLKRRWKLTLQLCHGCIRPVASFEGFHSASPHSRIPRQARCRRLLRVAAQGGLDVRRRPLHECAHHKVCQIFHESCPRATRGRYYPSSGV